MGGALPLSDAVDATDHVVPGDPDVPLRVHRPVGADGPLPCVYSMHGGGYVIGSNTIDDPLFDELCPKLGWSACRSSTGSRPRRPTRGRSRTATADCAGRTNTRPSWASTRTASASWA